MNLNMEVYVPGQEVKIAKGEMTALINCVALYAHGGVLYEVVWWKDGVRNSAWLNEQEISADFMKKKVGFRTG